VAVSVVLLGAEDLSLATTSDVDEADVLILIAIESAVEFAHSQIEANRPHNTTSFTEFAREFLGLSASSLSMRELAADSNS
jgi:hypothetical protein